MLLHLRELMLQVKVSNLSWLMGTMEINGTHIVTNRIALVAHEDLIINNLTSLRTIGGWEDSPGEAETKRRLKDLINGSG